MSIISPYFHKVLFYDLKLIHTLFPANTVEMVLSYDQRILKRGDDRFDFTIRGYPVGVTRQVQTDPELLRQREEIINPVYEEVRKVSGMFEKGVDCTDLVQRAGALTREGDTLLAQRFGMDLLFFGYGRADTVDSVKRELQYTRPNSSMCHFLESGFLPVHPSFNFIPQSADHQHCDPCGTFIEFFIFDLDAMIASARLRCPDKISVIESRITRLRFYILLDRLFDEVMLDPVYTWHITSHYMLQRVLFSLTEFVRKKFARQAGALQGQYSQAATFVKTTFDKTFKERMGNKPLVKE